MKLKLFTLISFLCALSLAHGSASPFFSLSARKIDGPVLKFSRYSGNNIVLIANVASECGYTDAGYEGLVYLNTRFSEKGLAILAFPCNQFGQQEPAHEEEIALFAEERGARFDIMEKVNVNGQNAHPVFKYLTENAEDSGPIYWNFEYFLVDHNGRIVNRYRTGVDLMSSKVVDEIADLINKLPRHDDL